MGEAFKFDGRKERSEATEILESSPLASNDQSDTCTVARFGKESASTHVGCLCYSGPAGSTNGPATGSSFRHK